MNPQEILETVSKHLFEQGIKSASENGHCLYRGPNGTKCAVGCLIPDNLYQEEWDFKKSGVMFGTIAAATGAGDQIKLLLQLQSVHDSGVYYNEGKTSLSAWKTTEGMRAALTCVGNEFKLDTKFLTELSFKDR